MFRFITIKNKNTLDRAAFYGKQLKILNVHGHINISWKNGIIPGWFTGVSKKISNTWSFLVKKIAGDIWETFFKIKK